MPTMPEGYYNRFDPSRNYDEHLFRAGYAVQSAEFNELQSALGARLEGVADALFRDGDIIRDARLVVGAAENGIVLCTAESGAVYIRGAVRGVAPATLHVPATGLVTVGLYLKETVVSELEDPGLRDPANGTRNYGEPGACRLKREAVWGYAGDGQSGEFFPVYQIEDGVLRAKEPPPTIDAVSQAITRYDRDSSGGTYIVDGLQTRLLSADAHEQIVLVDAGRARVSGEAATLATARRLALPVVPDLQFVDSEPHLSATLDLQRITLDFAPVANITKVIITAQKTVTLTHGGYSGVADPLPDTAVLALVEVRQGATTYTRDSDYRLQGGRVDWSLPGAEPATGSSYTVTYKYQTDVTPGDVRDNTLAVAGAVPDTLIFVSYNRKLPRIDRLVLAADGTLSQIRGVPDAWAPVPPAVPGNALALATLVQTWDSRTTLRFDGLRVVPMADLAAVNSRLDELTSLIAQQRLEASLNLREAGTKKGLFTDPFVDQSCRDLGVQQNAAIVGGVLTLPVEAVDARHVSQRPNAPVTLAASLKPVVSQTARTGDMKVNPYQSFAPVPARVQITPAVDRWTETTETESSAITRRFALAGSANSALAGTTSSASSSQRVVLSSESSAIEHLRPIEVTVSIAGFGPGEELASLTFDGMLVTPYQ